MSKKSNKNYIADLNRYDKMEYRRLEVIARTEMVRAHNIGSIAMYRDAGLESGIIQAEIATATDDRVCSICKPYNHKKMSFDKAEQLFPLHPQCRCAILPYNPEWEEFE